MDRRSCLSSALLVALAGSDAAVLALLAPHPARLARRSAHPTRWLDAVGVDAAVSTLCAGALWLLAAWVAVGLVAALAARLPGAAGALARRIAAAALPQVVYRAVIGAAGLGVLLSPAVASAAAPHTTAPHPGGTAAAASVAVPAPRVPSASLSAPRLPIGNAPVERAPSVQTHAAAAPSAGPAGRDAPPSARRADSQTITVRPGDSLWRIAAQRLGSPTPSRVAAAWPRWFAANRAVIGSDPDYLVPGEVLQAPENS